MAYFVAVHAIQSRRSSAVHHSSSLSSSIATSLSSSSSSSSSSRGRFWPLFSGVSALGGAAAGLEGRPDGAEGTAAVDDPGTGALKICCLRSVISAACDGAVVVGILKTPSSLVRTLDLDFAYDTFYAVRQLDKVLQSVTRSSGEAYHLLAQKFVPIERSHSLCRRLYVAIDNMRLAPHLCSLECNDIQDHTISGEEHVKRRSQVIFLDMG